MGLQRKRKIYKLDFAGTEYEGLEVKVGGLTTGEYLELVGLSAPGEEGGAETERMLRFFASHLRSWNLEEDGVAIPTSFEGIVTNDLSMNMTIIGAWTSALADVPEETEKKLPSGDLPLLASVPTEISSPSQPNSSEPN